MLDTTLQTKFLPESNRKGEMVTADWRFLLPSLELETVACLGLPPVSTVKVLANMCKRVIIFNGHALNHGDYENCLIDQGLQNVDLRSLGDLAEANIAEESIDLIFAADKKSVRRVIANAVQLPRLSRILKPNGALFFKLDGLFDRGLAAKSRSLFEQDGFSDPQEFFLAPALGRMRVALPLVDQEMCSFFESRIRSHRPIKNKLLRSYASFIGDFPRVILSRKNKTHCSDEPPEYLAGICRAAGLDVRKYRWAVAAGGRYNAKKIVFYLFDKENQAPEIVIKLTRSPEFNARLENEYRALTLLRDRKIVPEGSFPEPLFLDYHSRLAVVGQRVIRGQTFGEATDATANCQIMNRSLDWLTDLAVSTVQPSSGKEAAKSLQLIFTNFCEIYDLASEHQAFLKQKISVLEKSRAPFPGVFQHGDAGSWNVLITHDSEVAYVDWEAAESSGMPLWDVFYFLKTYGSVMLRKRAVHDSMAAFSENFLNPSQLGDRLVEVTHAYCRKLDLERALVEPLFYTCWMHRALKEATRLRRDALNKGHYLNLLKAAIEHRNTPILRRLFHQNDSDGA